MSVVADGERPRSNKLHLAHREQVSGSTHHLAKHEHASDVHKQPTKTSRHGQHRVRVGGSADHDPQEVDDKSEVRTLSGEGELWPRNGKENSGDEDETDERQEESEDSAMSDVSKRSPRKPVHGRHRRGVDVLDDEPTEGDEGHGCNEGE